MSGITGIFRRDGQDVDQADINNMNDKISHRGLMDPEYGVRTSSIRSPDAPHHPRIPSRNTPLKIKNLG